MKKLILLSSIAVLGLAYEGCGLTKKDALNSLSSSIYVSVNNQFSKNEEVHNGFLDYFSKSIKATSTQSSNVVLKNIKYIQKNNEWCAEVSKKDVIASAKESLKYLMSFNINDLPKSFNEKQKTIKDILSKIAFVKAILTLKQSEISKLNKLEKQLKDLSNIGEIIFNTNIPNAKIKISGIDKTYTPSTPIDLPAGEYSYTITAPNKCSINGNFTIKAKEVFTINKDLGDYPVLTFTSNQKNTKFKLNGKFVSLSKPITLNQCEGEANWIATFENQTENGKVELKPNLKDTISQDFTSRIQMKKIKEKINYYTKSKEVVISYGYGFTTSDKQKEWDSEKRLEIRQFNNYGIYKLGFGLLMGTQNEWTIKDMNEAEIAISARLQLPQIADTTLHIYSIPTIPYIGIEGGWDFYKFFDKMNYDTNDITGIIRGTTGITFLFNKQFGINVEYSHDFGEKKDNIITTGIVMDF